MLQLISTLVFGLLIAVQGTTAVKVAAGQLTSLSGATPAATVAVNVQTILSLASQAAAANVSLIAFPEFALMGNFTYSSCTAPSSVAAYSEVIGAAGATIQCGLSTPLSAIGCSEAAKHMHISYNTVEADNDMYYNTQVVVHNGVMVARYRKYNVFYQKCFNSPQLELITFAVQNKTFGIFTCYDILFDHPKMDLVKAGVKYFSYSSAIPLIGTDAVQLFSAMNKVNVVSADMDFGQSAIVNNGLTLARAPSSGNAIAVANLP